MKTNAVQQTIKCARYEELRRSRPALWPAQDGPIRILEPTRGLARVAYEDPWTVLLVDEVEFPDGRLGTYVRSVGQDRPEGAVVIPMTSTGFVLLRHWRHALQSWSLQFPRGFGEVDHSDLGTASAELREETGLQARSFDRIGRVHGDDGLLLASAVVVLARIDDDLSRLVTEPLASPEILDFEEMRRAIAGGLITDGYTLSAWAILTASGQLP